MPDGTAGSLLLDTHVWLWAVQGEQGRLSAPVVDATA